MWSKIAPSNICRANNHGKSCLWELKFPHFMEVGYDSDKWFFDARIPIPLFWRKSTWRRRKLNPNRGWVFKKIGNKWMSSLWRKFSLHMYVYISVYVYLYSFQHLISNPGPYRSRHMFNHGIIAHPFHFYFILYPNLLSKISNPYLSSIFQILRGISLSEYLHVFQTLNL